MNHSKQMQFTENQIDGIKAGISDIMQGCMTLNKVLTMMQIPEESKYPNGRPTVIHDSHVQCYERFKASLHDAHVQAYYEQIKHGAENAEK